MLAKKKKKEKKGKKILSDEESYQKTIKEIKKSSAHSLKKAQNVLSSIAKPTEQIRAVLESIGIYMPESLTIVEYAIYMNIAKCMQNGDTRALVMLLESCGITMSHQMNIVSISKNYTETNKEDDKTPTLNEIEKEASKMLLYNDNNKKEKND